MKPAPSNRGGGKLELPSAKKNFLSLSYARQVVQAIIALLNIKIVPVSSGAPEVVYSDHNVVIKLPSAVSSTTATNQTVPFEIYQRPAPTSWLHWQVRTGLAITTGAPVAPSLVETEFALTSGVARYWFYVDFESSPTIAVSATTLTWSATKVPLGWVDTATYAANNRAVPTQFWRDHIFNPCA